jgi:hypothetical protein
VEFLTERERELGWALKPSPELALRIEAGEDIRPRKGSRASGTNPRALGTNPRAHRRGAEVSYKCTVCGRKFPGPVKAEVILVHIVGHGLVEKAASS